MPRRDMRMGPVRLVLLAGMGVAGAGSALGQNALGDGRSLQTSTQRTGVFQPTQLDFASEIRLRNAVVTGNAPGGRSLQIPTPYADADDFRGALGSDSLFRFRRDSYGAGSLGMGFRGTESLQYQYANTTGNARDAGIVTRLNSARALPLPPGRAPVTSTGARFASPQLENTPEAGALRSTASFSAVRGLSPAVVGMRQTRDGFERVTASSLLGLRQDAMVPDMKTGQLVEKSDVNSDAARAVSTSAQASLEADRSRDLAVPSTAYDELLGRFRKHEPEAPGDDRAWTRTPAAKPVEPAPGAAAVEPQPAAGPQAKPVLPVTPEGASGPASTPPAGEEKKIDGAPTWEDNLDALRTRLMASGITAPRTPAPRRDAAGNMLDASGNPVKRDAAMDQAVFDAIREAGGKAESYLRENPNPGDLYGTLIHDGQSLIARKQYFSAEEYFARALGMRPGDVTAMAGRLHSQLGAGLYLSAALNLRQLYEQHPEVIGMRFTGDTIPEPQRLAYIKNELRGLLEQSARHKALPTPESALLLAYVGFQTEDPAAIRLGLDALERERAADAAVRNVEAPQPDPLLPVLRGVWLPEKPDAP